MNLKKTFWFCKNQKHGCKARLVTSGKTMEILNSNHNHTPLYSEEQIKKKSITKQVVTIRRRENYKCATPSYATRSYAAPT